MAKTDDGATWDESNNFDEQELIAERNKLIKTVQWNIDYHYEKLKEYQMQMVLITKK